MEFEDSDFLRNPVVQNEMFFLESKCVSCGAVNRRIVRVGRVTPDAMRARRIPLHDRVSRRAIALNCRSEGAHIVCGNHSEARPMRA